MYIRYTASALLITLLVTAGFSGCSKTETLILSGTIESTQINVNSEVSGKVVKLNKDEGDLVSEGDVLVFVDSKMEQLSVKQYEAAYKIKEALLTEIESGSRPEQVKQAEASVRNAEAALKLASDAVKSSENTLSYLSDKLENVKQIFKNGGTSKSELDDAQYKYDEALRQLSSTQNKYNSAKAQLDSSSAQLELIESGSTSEAVKAARADLEQAGIALEIAKLKLSKYEVKSPSSGTLLMKNVEIGDIVSTGSNLAVISDLNDLWVNVYIPQHSLGLVSLNQEIILKSPAADQKNIKGKVIFISGEAEFTPKNIQTNEAKENTVFKLKIKTLDNVQYLKPGMTVDVYIDKGSAGQ